MISDGWYEYNTKISFTSVMWMWAPESHSHPVQYHRRTLHQRHWVELPANGSSVEPMSVMHTNQEKISVMLQNTKKPIISKNTMRLRDTCTVPRDTKYSLDR